VQVIDAATASVLLGHDGAASTLLSEREIQLSELVPVFVTRYEYGTTCPAAVTRVVVDDLLTDSPGKLTVAVSLAVSPPAESQVIVAVLTNGTLPRASDSVYVQDVELPAAIVVPTKAAQDPMLFVVLSVMAAILCWENVPAAIVSRNVTVTG